MIGVVGAGRMGLPIAARLAAAHYRVLVYDRDDEQLASAAAAGCRTAPDATEVAAAADVMITVLPGPSECREVMAGTGRALAHLRAGSCWLDLTSNAPRVAEQIAAAAQDFGVGAVGAPMRGGPPEAAAGTLGFYLGGRDTDCRRVQPILDVLGGAEAGTRVGDRAGDRHVAKLLANSLWFGQVVAVTETLLLGQSLGLAPRALSAVLADSPAASSFIDQHLPALLRGDYLESFGIDRVVEELDTLTSLAGTPADILRLVTRDTPEHPGPLRSRRRRTPRREIARRTRRHHTAGAADAGAETSECEGHRSTPRGQPADYVIRAGDAYSDAFR